MAANTVDHVGRKGFSQPSNNSPGKWQPPPRKHCIAQVTGGLGDIYTKLESGWSSTDEDYSKCINEDNFFQPNFKGGLMAGRYQVISVLGRGNSSTILLAQDTFRPGLYQVAIKILKPEYFRLGYQESHLIAELNKADIHNFCGIVKLLNTFTLGSFFCMTFELLGPLPLHQVFKKIKEKTEKLAMIRKVALRMLQILGFLGQQNVIHADLKPENILCNSENICDGIKVIDFGNAIHGVYEELSLYYDEFELQTLLYRAPEVLFGLPFGQEIDMWSLGCILAELYLGKPLFWAKTKKELLTQMTSLLGPLPTKVYQRAKFYTHFKEFVGQPSSFMDNFSTFGTKLDCIDFKFVSFLERMLSFDPGDRMTVSEAIQHPFMGPELAIKYVLPVNIHGSEASSTYCPIDLTPTIYTHTPAGTQDSRNKHLSSIELLHQGTRDSSIIKQKVIHKVAPFEPCESKTAEMVGTKLEPKVEPSEPCVSRDVETISDKVKPKRESKTNSQGEGHSRLQVRDTVKKAAMCPAESMNKNVPTMPPSSSIEKKIPQKPLHKDHPCKESERSLKVKEKPSMSSRSSGRSHSDVDHVKEKREQQSPGEKLPYPSIKDESVTPQPSPKETKHSISKSKSDLSSERTQALDMKSLDDKRIPSDQFKYLNKERTKAISRQNKSLGVNVMKMKKSPVKARERSHATASQTKKGSHEKKSELRLSDGGKKSESPPGSKGMMIYDEKKPSHPKKDVTWLVSTERNKNLFDLKTRRKSEEILKGHKQKQVISSKKHKHVKNSSELSSNQSHKSKRSQENANKNSDKRTCVYDFIVTPEKMQSKSGSRKRSLHLGDDSVGKRSNTKDAPLLKRMKDSSNTSTFERPEKCLSEALVLDSHASEAKQGDAKRSYSSHQSSEPCSLSAKMSIFSRMKASGNNSTSKHPIPSPSIASSSLSSSSKAVKSSLHKRWSLESSPFQNQSMKSRASRDKSKAKMNQIQSPSPPSSPQSSHPSQYSSSVTPHPNPSQHGSKASLQSTAGASPALHSKRSSSRASPRQRKNTSPPVQKSHNHRTGSRAETKPKDQLSDDDDEILFL